jgi:hypothetical protein
MAAVTDKIAEGNISDEMVQSHEDPKEAGILNCIGEIYL